MCVVIQVRREIGWAICMYVLSIYVCMYLCTLLGWQSVPVSEPSPCGDGHGSELHLPTYIPDGEHSGGRSVLVVIHHYVAILVRFHRHTIQP